MLFQVNRFNKECLEVLEKPEYSDYSLAEYTAEKKYGDDFLYNYLIPMSSAVWSSPPDIMLNFPAKTLIRFFYNHGFLGLNTQHQWYTVVDGSQSYMKIITKHYMNKIILNNGIASVKRVDGKVVVTEMNGDEKIFDKVIFASHADETLKILSDATTKESELLDCFKYQYNKATLHTDSEVMPKNKKAWSAWNYRIEEKNGETKTSTIYFMNMLQQVSDKQNYFVSINDPGNIEKNKIIREIDYTHPVFDLNAINAQEQLMSLNWQGNNTYFCGSYFKYGFHEDAFTSALELSRLLAGGIEGW